MIRSPDERTPGLHSRLLRRDRLVRTVCCLAFVLALQGCAASESEEPADQDPRGARMAGPVVDVEVTRDAVESKPLPPVLTDPESAVRSYLAWTAYAYRIGQSQAAHPTMTAKQEVRVDSYVQYNLQQYRLLDQSLVSITFGTPIVEGDRAFVPVTESWAYRYVSATEAGRVLGGPYEASYEATYTVVSGAQGEWVVDEVEATTQDAVK